MLYFLHRSRKSDQELTDLSFSILLEDEPHNLDFVAPDQIAFDYWTDGISCLLGKYNHQTVLNKVHES